jgi:hypothetical protein
MGRKLKPLQDRAFRIKPTLGHLLVKIRYAAWSNLSMKLGKSITLDFLAVLIIS